LMLNRSSSAPSFRWSLRARAAPGRPDDMQGQSLGDSMHR